MAWGRLTGVVTSFAHNTRRVSIVLAWLGAVPVPRLEGWCRCAVAAGFKRPDGPRRGLDAQWPRHSSNRLS
jgi:hypothetical protein